MSFKHTSASVSEWQIFFSSFNLIGWWAWSQIIGHIQVRLLFLFSYQHLVALAAQFRLLPSRLNFIFKLSCVRRFFKISLYTDLFTFHLITWCYILIPCEEKQSLCHYIVATILHNWDGVLWHHSSSFKCDDVNWCQSHQTKQYYSSRLA